MKNKCPPRDAALYFRFDLIPAEFIVVAIAIDAQHVSFFKRKCSHSALLHNSVCTPRIFFSLDVADVLHTWFRNFKTSWLAEQTFQNVILCAVSFLSTVPLSKPFEKYTAQPSSLHSVIVRARLRLITKVVSRAPFELFWCPPIACAHPSTLVAQRTEVAICFS